MQTQYTQRHQVARAGFARVPVAFPVCAMGIASWSNEHHTLDLTTGKPAVPRPPSVSTP